MAKAAKSIKDRAHKPVIAGKAVCKKTAKKKRK